MKELEKERENTVKPGYEKTLYKRNPFVRVKFFRDYLGLILFYPGFTVVMFILDIRNIIVT